jgi:hypothetical protein
MIMNTVTSGCKNIVTLMRDPRGLGTIRPQTRAERNSNNEYPYVAGKCYQPSREKGGPTVASSLVMFVTLNAIHSRKARWGPCEFLYSLLRCRLRQRRVDMEAIKRHRGGASNEYSVKFRIFSRKISV